MPACWPPSVPSPARAAQRRRPARGPDGKVDLTKARERLAGIELVAATDVDAPLLGPEGAALGFGAQKGADRAGREQLETALRIWATATDGAVAVKGGAGAGGGIGFALLLLGATRVPGAQLALDAVQLPVQAAKADLLLTGEGAFDWQSLRGKVVAGVARVGQALWSPDGGPRRAGRGGQAGAVQRRHRLGLRHRRHAGE